jgi:hypothetical protein
VIHIAAKLSFYSFGAPYQVTHNGRSSTAVGLTAVDSTHQSYSALRLDRHLRQRVATAERAAALCSPHLLSDPPAALLSAQGCEQYLQRLRDDFPANLPSAIRCTSAACACGA